MTAPRGADTYGQFGGGPPSSAKWYGAAVDAFDGWISNAPPTHARATNSKTIRMIMDMAHSIARKSRMVLS